MDAQQTTGTQRLDIEQLLADGYTIRIHPQGYSMYPLFVPGRDEAVIEPLAGRSVRRGDVVLYRREGSILVLHRILRVTEGGVYLVGDNQTQVEGPLLQGQLRGILTGFVRNGREYGTDGIWYRLYAGVWLCLRPFRHHIAATAHALKTFFWRKTG